MRILLNNEASASVRECRKRAIVFGFDDTSFNSILDDWIRIFRSKSQVEVEDIINKVC
jgi:hypothetical protein